jgi:hypothetical protein
MGIQRCRIHRRIYNARMGNVEDNCSSQVDFFTVVERNANVQVLRWVVRPTMRADSNLELCGEP